MTVSGSLLIHRQRRAKNQGAKSLRTTQFSTRSRVIQEEGNLRDISAKGFALFSLSFRAQLPANLKPDTPSFLAATTQDIKPAVRTYLSCFYDPLSIDSNRLTDLRDPQAKMIQAQEALALLAFELPDPDVCFFGQVLRQITIFSKLPIEIRLKIWRNTFPPPRRVNLLGDSLSTYSQVKEQTSKFPNTQGRSIRGE